MGLTLQEMGLLTEVFGRDAVVAVVAAVVVVAVVVAVVVVVAVGGVWIQISLGQEEGLRGCSRTKAEAWKSLTTSKKRSQPTDSWC